MVCTCTPAYPLGPKKFSHSLAMSSHFHSKRWTMVCLPSMKWLSFWAVATAAKQAIPSTTKSFILMKAWTMPQIVIREPFIVIRGDRTLELDAVFIRFLACCHLNRFGDSWGRLTERLDLDQDFLQYWQRVFLESSKETSGRYVFVFAATSINFQRFNNSLRFQLNGIEPNTLKHITGSNITQLYGNKIFEHNIFW